MSGRALMLAVALAFALASAAGCPDPCAFGGNGCNDSDDCGFRKVCRKSRDFEGAGCAVLAGTCIDADDDQTCGSIDDCAEGECCDPGTNLCVGEVGYVNRQCDEHTCGDCDETAFGDRCELSDDCRDDETCSAADANQFDTIEEKGLCRPSCDSDDDCPAVERCQRSVCSVPIGTPCLLPADVDDTGTNDQCLGLNCTQLDAAGDRGDDGYCTGFCSTVEGFQTCPLGFVCDEDALECRRL